MVFYLGYFYTDLLAQFEVCSSCLFGFRFLIKMLCETNWNAWPEIINHIFIKNILNQLH